MATTTKIMEREPMPNRTVRPASDLWKEVAEILMESKAEMAIRDADSDTQGDTDGDKWVAAAADRAGVPEADRVGLWVGGLACPFGEIYEPTLGWWVETIHEDAFDETLRDINDPDVDWHASFCLDHACTVNSGLLGNTNTTGEMGAYFWVEKKETELGAPGLYALTRVAEFDGSPGEMAAEAIRRDGVQGMSIGFWTLVEEADEEKYDPKVLFTVMKVKLMEASGVDHAAYRTTFMRAGVMGGNDMAENRDIRSERSEYQVRCTCSTASARTGDTGEFREELARLRESVDYLSMLLDSADEAEASTKGFTPVPIP